MEFNQHNQFSGQFNSQFINPLRDNSMFAYKGRIYRNGSGLHVYLGLQDLLILERKSRVARGLSEKTSVERERKIAV